MIATTSAAGRVLEIVDAHAATEETTDIDVDRIMATVSHNPRYALKWHDGPLTVFDTTEGVRQMYSKKRSDADFIEERSRKRIVSDWYLFTETAGRFRYKGELNGVDRTGLEFSQPVALFLPVEAEGTLIRGEFCAYAQTVPEAVEQALRPDAARAAGPETGPALIDLHHELLTALRAADTGRLRSLFAPDALFVTRDYEDPAGGLLQLEGVDAIVDHYASLLAGATTSAVSLMSIASADWYVFAEHRWAFVDPAGVSTERRVAGIFTPGPSATIRTHLGYAAD
jgi:hypothetical protein